MGVALNCQNPDPEESWLSQFSVGSPRRPHPTLGLNIDRCIMYKFFLCKFRQCEDYFEQSKSYFEPLTFASKRCLLQLEYFEFVCIFIEYFYFVYLRFNYISKTQTPGNKSERKKVFCLNLITESKMFHGNTMFIGNSQKGSSYLSSPVYRCRVWWIQN